jgi:hypothetical protein
VTARTFGAGIAVCLAVLVVIGVVIHSANAGHHRPGGAAEHWLSAVSDTTRKGVRDDAVKRAEKIGPVSVAAPLLNGIDAEKKSAFPDLEVGKAVVAGTTARVPFRLHVRNQDVPRSGTIVLSRAGDSWHVASLAGPEGKVPSEGGPPPSSASAGLFVGGVVVSLLLTALASLLVEWAGRASRKPVAAT